jgi:hypothetical protein
MLMTGFDPKTMLDVRSFLPPSFSAKVQCPHALLLQTNLVCQCSQRVAALHPSPAFQAKAMRGQVEELMKTKLEMLTPVMVKELVEEMIRTHLGWLVVWASQFLSLSLFLLLSLGALPLSRLPAPSRLYFLLFPFTVCGAMVVL